MAADLKTSPLRKVGSQTRYQRKNQEGGELCCVARPPFRRSSSTKPSWPALQSQKPSNGERRAEPVIWIGGPCLSARLLLTVRQLARLHRVASLSFRPFFGDCRKRLRFPRGTNGRGLSDLTGLIVCTRTPGNVAGFLFG
jgi:hypothetical protein